MYIKELFVFNIVNRLILERENKVSCSFVFPSL